jgi:hypothetical protein
MVSTNVVTHLHAHIIDAVLADLMLILHSRVVSVLSFCVVLCREVCGYQCVGIFARVDIPPETEITFDYQYERYGGKQQVSDTTGHECMHKHDK